MGESKGKLLLYALFLVLLLFGLARIIAPARGRFLQLEIAGFALLLILSLVGFVLYNRPAGERILFYVFLFYTANLILIWLFFNSLYIVLLGISLVGMLISFPQKGKSKKIKSSEVKPHSEIKAKHKDTDKTPPAEQAEEKSVASAKATPAATKYSPGKYVASKNSNRYHEPKCDWAKKIRSDRRIWFESKEKAWEKGFRAHDCVK
ncbi:MAG: hypothetical protein AB1668_05585 [Nanoarchaeota archaeon]